MRIPIKTYLFKYLSAQLGTDKFVLKQIPAAGANTNELLWQKRLSELIFPLVTTDHPYKPDELKLKNYTIISMHPTDWLVNNKRLFISERGVRIINSELYNWFMEDLCECLDEAISNRQRIDLRIIQFMDRFNINEDDIRLDSLKRNYHRERTKTNEKISKNNLGVTQLVLDLSFSNKLIQT
jgi:hypothetical protein